MFGLSFFFFFFSASAQNLRGGNDRSLVQVLERCPSYIYDGFCDAVDIIGGAACLEDVVMSGAKNLTEPSQIQCVPERNGGVEYKCPSGFTKCLGPEYVSCPQGEFPNPSGLADGTWTYGNRTTTFDGQWCYPQASKLVYDWEAFGLEQVLPADEKYYRAFDQLACGGVADPSWIWGDNGPGVPGYGGINSYAVVKVVQEDLWLYGARGAFGDDISNVRDLNSPWFVDAQSIADHPDLNKYQNDIVATCFDWSYWMECKIRPGTVMVVGSGAPRNCSAAMNASWPGILNEHNDGPSCVDQAAANSSQSYCYPTNPAIKEYQEPSNAILQYVMTPMLEHVGPLEQNIELCNVCELNVDDVTQSCDTGFKFTVTPDTWETPAGVKGNKTELPSEDGAGQFCLNDIKLKRRR